MRPDNTERLITAARRRRADTLTRAQNAVRAAAARGEPITVAALAAAAGVSRSWLYAEASLRPQLDALRSTGGRRPARRPVEHSPPGQRRLAQGATGPGSGAHRASGA
jgi:hypothetical protein